MSRKRDTPCLRHSQLWIIAPKKSIHINGYNEQNGNIPFIHLYRALAVKGLVVSLASYMTLSNWQRVSLAAGV